MNEWMNSILEKERAPRIRVDVKGTCEFKNDERGWGGSKSKELKRVTMINK